MTWCSVVIPTLNEAAWIGAVVGAVRALDPTVELIVADGGSSDGTAELAAAAGALVVRSPRGRGRQLNAGAARARGDLLLFLHADTTLPSLTFPLLRRHFADPTAQIAKFRLRFDLRHPLLDLAARLMWIDTPWSSFGDQGLVVRRSFFIGLGGFPEWPLFEDVRLFELARARTRVHVLPAEVITSARRFLANGVLRQLLLDAWYMLQYQLGISPQQLARRYERSDAAVRGALGL